MGFIFGVYTKFKWVGNVGHSMSNILSDSFEPITEELPKVVLELIGKDNEVENLKKYVGILANLCHAAKCDVTFSEQRRRIWTEFWRTLNQLIEEDRDTELTTLCVKEVSHCIETIQTEV